MLLWAICPINKSAKREFAEGMKSSVEPAGEVLSHDMSLKTILSDCEKEFVEIKRKNAKQMFAENLFILVF